MSTNEDDTVVRESTFVSVAEQIWRFADCYPASAALVGPCESLTFNEVTRRAAILSSSFAAALEGRRGVIAIASDRIADIVVGALAAWRLRCSYLPVDPAGPPLRLNHMLTEAEVQIVATAESQASAIPAGSWSLVILDQIPDTDVAGLAEGTDCAWEIHSNDLAYVIYTSGSTGEPKGVAITQANLRHLIDWHHEAFRVTSNDRGAQFAPVTFDAAVLETWPLLSAGASLHTIDSTTVLMPERLRDHLVNHAITLCFAVTPLAEQLIQLPWPSETSLRCLLTGADTLRTFPPAGLPFSLVNNYGPTECTVLATSGIVHPRGKEQSEFPSIGRAIARTEVLLMDPDLRPVPDGIRGQICIAGAGVGAGYVGRPDLTFERFPTLEHLGGQRAYLTGDVGRKLPNGEFEFCGRIDDQIKIRGYRIEPEEIIRALREHPAIRAAAVVALGNGADTRLTAYVVTSEVGCAELRTHLAHRLPAYMIPDTFVGLSELPLKPSGKLDRSALPSPTAENVLDEESGVQELQTEIQSGVGAILSKLLGRTDIGLNDNFFRIGGHSMLAAQLIARLRDAFKVDVPLRSVFEAPTVAGLSSEIEARILSKLAGK